MKKKRVLLIDDQKNWLEVFGQTLKEMGFEVVYSDNLEDIVDAKTVTSNYDLILVDVHLESDGGGDYKGVLFLEELKKIKKGKLPLIILTGFSCDEKTAKNIKQKYSVSAFISKGSPKLEKVSEFEKLISSITEGKDLIEDVEWYDVNYSTGL